MGGEDHLAVEAAKRKQRPPASRDDKPQTLELLAEARTLLDSSPQDSSKLTSRLQLAQNYHSLDLQQSVALVESIILQVNKLVAAAVVLDGF